MRLEIVVFLLTTYRKPFQTTSPPLACNNPNDISVGTIHALYMDFFKPCNIISKILINLPEKQNSPHTTQIKKGEKNNTFSKPIQAFFKAAYAKQYAQRQHAKGVT